MPSKKVWSADLRVHATVYVRAKSRKKATEKIQQTLGDCLEAGIGADICDLDFAHPNLPEISFSPAMTIDDEQEFVVYKDNG